MRALVSRFAFGSCWFSILNFGHSIQIRSTSFSHSRVSDDERPAGAGLDVVLFCFLHSACILDAVQAWYSHITYVCLNFGPHKS